MTKQPIWELVAQLGDANPREYGGYFVFKDTTGVYPPEGEILVSPEDMGLDKSDEDKWQVWRFILEPCTYENGILSDNKYHKDTPVWFADKLNDLASTFGTTKEEVIVLFLSGDICDNAQAWRMVGEYFGWVELDQYPLTLTRDEMETRYADAKYSL